MKKIFVMVLLPIYWCLVVMIVGCGDASNPVTETKQSDARQQVVVPQTIHIVVQNKATNEVSIFEAMSFNLDNNVLTIQVTLTTVEIFNLTDYYISGVVL